MSDINKLIESHTPQEIKAYIENTSDLKNIELTDISIQNMTKVYNSLNSQKLAIERDFEDLVYFLSTTIRIDYNKVKIFIKDQILEFETGEKEYQNSLLLLQSSMKFLSGNQKTKASKAFQLEITEGVKLNNRIFNLCQQYKALLEIIENIGSIE